MDSAPRGTYAFSRNPGVDPNLRFTDPRDRIPDYALLGMRRKYTFTMFGTHDRPSGPNGYRFTSNNGLVSQFVGIWQLSRTGNISTRTAGVDGLRSLLGRGAPNIAGPFNPKADISWPAGARAGNMYAKPQCTNSLIVAPRLQPSCTLTAVAHA
jgi:hypothetical protein